MAAINELKISVPWGFIAAKTWYSNQNNPILVVHGLQDNASSFDLLIPKLLPNFYYVCIDLPGHGQSSHLPSNTPIFFMSFVLSIKYVVDYFHWKKFSVISHSLGTRITHCFAILYPELIDRFVSIDAISMFPIHPSRFCEYYLEKFNTFQLISTKLQKGIAPDYTYEEALTRVLENRQTIVCREGAINMLKRALIPTANGKFNLSMDQRLKCVIYENLSPNNLAAILKNRRIRFPHLTLIATETYDLKIFDDYEPVLKEMKKNKNFKLITVKGNHDIHNNNPDVVAKYINIFLEKNFVSSKL